MKTVLITGASGMIGTALTKHLLAAGHTVRHLGRNKKGIPGVQEFLWDLDVGTIEKGALEGADVVVHLAGSNVGKGRWTEEKKKEIIESRVKSSALLEQYMQQPELRPAKVVGASAIGYYGTERDDQVPAAESDPPGTDFMAEVCVAWETAVKRLPVQHFIVRIGVVLSDRGGALPTMAQPVRFFAGAPLGSGKQVVSWIHIDDLCRIFMKGIEEQPLEGIFNGVAPQPVTNEALTKAIGKALSRPVWPLPVPGGILKMLLGEMADVVLNGVRVSSGKIENVGMKFRFGTVETAVSDLL